LGEIKRVDEQTRVAELPAAAASHEAAKLLLSRSSLPRRLLLERAEGSKVSLSVHNLLDGGGAESADQLVLQVGDAHVETERFHVGASEVGAEAGLLETALEVTLLSGVTETSQPDVKPLRAEQIQEASYGLRATDRHNGNALGVQIATPALGERFECRLVAGPFDEDDRTQVDAGGQRVICGVKSLLLVHVGIFTGMLKWWAPASAHPTKEEQLNGIRHFLRNFTATAVNEHLRSEIEGTGAAPELTTKEVELVRYIPEGPFDWGVFLAGRPDTS
jgi:hypothetical protein